MASQAGLSRRADLNTDNVILIAAIISGAVAVVALVVLVIVLVRRRRHLSRQSLYGPPIAPCKDASDVSVNSSLLRGGSSDWPRPSPYPLSSHRPSALDASVRSSLMHEIANPWYHPSPYPTPSHKRTTSDGNSRPSLQDANTELGYSKPYQTHSRFPSDASSRPLLLEMNNDHVHMGRPVPVHRTTEEDILSNNPTGQYRVPVSRPTSRGSDHTPASSSLCLPGADVTLSSDNPYLAPRPLIPLPPLIIPQKATDWIMSSQIPSTVMEESAASRSATSCASSASSAYSQLTATPPLHPIDLPEVPSSEKGPQEERVGRRDTTFVGTLLKARAERNPDGLVRDASQVSHIERTGSIKTIGGSDRAFSRRYRAKK